MKSKRGSTHKAPVWSQRKNSKRFVNKGAIHISNSCLSKLLKRQKSITLFSIKPKYSRLIFSGKKKFELRKTLPRIKNKLIAVYETSPTKKVVGICEISNYYELPLKKISKFIKKSQVDDKFIYQYYENSDKFVAIEITKTYPFRKSLNLEEFSKKQIVAPQSFSYMDPLSLCLS